MTYMATPLHQNPYPRGHKIYNFDRPFLGHHYYKLSLSDQCLKEYAFSQYDLFGHALAQEPLPRG